MLYILYIQMLNRLNVKKKFWVLNDDESWAFETSDQEYIYGNNFFSIGSFIYYKTQAEMCYKWIQISNRI